MSITIKREKNNRGVKLRSLHAGDTFLYDNRVGVMMDGGGFLIPYDLTSCIIFRRNHCGNSYTGEMDGDLIVLPIEVELTYKVVG